MTRALQLAEQRSRIEAVVTAAFDEMSELEAAVAFADWREDGEANTEALAEQHEVSIATVQAHRMSARALMLAAGRSVAKIEDWSELRRVMGFQTGFGC